VPLRAYQPKSPPCRLCGAGFEVMQVRGEPPLSECPKCGQPVEPRGAAPVNSPRLAKPASVTDAKSAGFTMLKRISSGEYEKQ
jgi:hypothetical protein